MLISFLSLPFYHAYFPHLLEIRSLNPNTCHPFQLSLGKVKAIICRRPSITRMAMIMSRDHDLVSSLHPSMNESNQDDPRCAILAGFVEKQDFEGAWRFIKENEIQKSSNVDLVYYALKVMKALDFSLKDMILWHEEGAGVRDDVRIWNVFLSKCLDARIQNHTSAVQQAKLVLYHMVQLNLRVDAESMLLFASVCLNAQAYNDVWEFLDTFNNIEVDKDSELGFRAYVKCLIKSENYNQARLTLDKIIATKHLSFKLVYEDAIELLHDVDQFEFIYSLFLNLLENNIVLNETAFGIYINAALQIMEYEMACASLITYISYGKTPTENCLLQLLSYTLKHRSYNFKTFLDDLKVFELNLSASSYKKMMIEASRQQDFDNVDYFYNQFLSENLRYRSDVLYTFITACDIAEKPQHAMESIEDALSKALNVPSKVYNSAMATFVRLNEANLIKRMFPFCQDYIFRYGWDLEISHCLIRYYGFVDQMDNALQVLIHMRDNNIDISVSTYNLILNICSKYKDSQMGMRLLKEMESFHLQPNALTISLLAKCFESSTEIDYLVSLISNPENFELFHELDTRLFNTLISVYKNKISVEEQQQEDAVDLYDNLFTKLDRLNLMQNEYFFEQAFNLYNTMTQYSIAPDIYTFNLLLGICSKMGAVERARNIMKEMRNLGVLPSEISYTVMISLLGKYGHLDEAFKYFGEMCDFGIGVHSPFAYCTLIAACGKLKQWERAKEVFEFMICRGGNMPSIEPYNALMMVGLRCSKPKEVMSLFHEILAWKLELNASTAYVLAISCLRYKRFFDHSEISKVLEEIDKIFEKIADKKQNAKTLTVCMKLRKFIENSREDSRQQRGI